MMNESDMNQTINLMFQHQPTEIDSGQNYQVNIMIYFLTYQLQ